MPIGMTSRISSGHSLAGPLAASGHFPKMVVEMIAVAEESNTLDTVLVGLADDLEKRTSRQLDLFVRLLEPIMLMELEVPENFQGAVVGNISARRGIVMSTDMVGKLTKIIAEVPLAETFGYSTDLRSMTQGQGTFTMELAKYRAVPANIQAEVIAERKAELQPA